jgi:uncharacterized membrane protein
MVDLGAGSGWDVSADGLTVVGTTPSGLFRYEQGVGRVDVSLGSGPSKARVSADGRVVVADTWRWAAGSSPVQMPAVGSNFPMRAEAVSADGSVIVGSAQTSLGLEPARWTAAGGAVPLGRIPGGLYDSAATVVSADGSIAYGPGRGPSGYDTFRWTATTGMVGLGVATGGLLGIPFPMDVTPDGGIIVGGALGEAFVWTVGSGPENLAEVLTEHYGINLGSFQLLSAMSVSDDGRVLVGSAYDGVGHNVGWRVELPWSIPGPGSTVLVAGLVLATASRARRQPSRGHRQRAHRMV